jgi:hypothetical protein
MLPKRISEETMDEAETTKKNSSTETTSEPYIVVACPSCETKFAVESGLIASYEIPRFHCSRCDAVFERKPETKKALDQGANAESTSQPTNRWILQDDTSSDPRNSDLVAATNSPATERSPLKSTDFSLGDIPELDTFDESPSQEGVENRAGLSILGFRPTASRRHSSSLTRGEARALVARVRQESIGSDDPFSLFDDPEQAAKTKEETQQTEAHTVSSVAAPVAHQPISEEIPAKRSTNRFSGVLRRLVPRNQGLTRMALPLVCSLGLLCLIALVSRVFPNAIDSLFRSAVPSFISGKTAQLPPPEISVQDLNLVLEKTQSHETIPVVRGVVANSGDQIYEDVTIEALGFNSRGELLVRARAPLRSALSREKISDLTLDTVKKFQNALSASDSSIKGGEKIAFSVALLPLDIDAREVTYFSARVFSVGRTR